MINLMSLSSAITSELNHINLFNTIFSVNVDI